MHTSVRALCYVTDARCVLVRIDRERDREPAHARRCRGCCGDEYILEDHIILIVKIRTHINLDLAAPGRAVASGMYPQLSTRYAVLIDVMWK